MEQTVRAAGAVLWRQVGPDAEVAMVHRPRYGDWSLPKGKLVDGETSAHAAVREVAEETGFTARLSRRLGTTEYRLPETGHTKTVTYYGARALDGGFTRNAEVDELRWLSAADAADLATHDHDRRVLDRFTAVTEPIRTVLLVRHAKAGKKADWTGEDGLRPLSCAGASQAGALRTLLPLFGARRVFSAPPLRCLQTVQQVATDLGVPIVQEPLLSEDGYWLEPGAGVGRFLAIAEGDGVAVVCSQGGVIPDLIATLTTTLPEPVAAVSKKASLWVLSFAEREPRLVSADYYASPLPAPAAG